jgi:hypothetical protein
MKVISYDAAVAAAPYRTPGYLDELLASGTPVLRGDQVISLRIDDEVYKNLAAKYRLAPNHVWVTQPMMGQYIHKCSNCGRAIVNDNPSPPEGQCKMPVTPQPEPPAGVGSQIKKILSRVGVKATKSCGCNQKARDIDRMGKKWATNNKQKIVGMLKEEADKRHLPFSPTAANTLVNLAIWTAPRTGNP